MQTLNPMIAGSFNGVARGRRRGLEGKPEADKVENVKVERIDNQEVLRAASPSDTIRIFLSDDNRSTIENLIPRIYIKNKKGKVDVCICPPLVVYRKKETRDDCEKLFRVAKNAEGSYIEEMKYSEVRNDYEAYWSVINDPETSPALLANCMRNILDYFFGFVDRLEFNNIFNIPELKDVRFTAFNHYMNRESHNGPENISDYKEINYVDFHDALKLVFEKTGFGKHYKKMRKVSVMKV